MTQRTNTHLVRVVQWMIWACFSSLTFLWFHRSQEYYFRVHVYLNGYGAPILSIKKWKKKVRCKISMEFCFYFHFHTGTTFNNVWHSSSWIFINTLSNQEKDDKWNCGFPWWWRVKKKYWVLSCMEWYQGFQRFEIITQIKKLKKLQRILQKHSSAKQSWVKPIA